MAKIVIELPEECKALKKPFENVIKRVCREVSRAAGGRGREYAKVEAALGEDVAAVERACNATVLAALDVDAARVTINGTTYSKIGRAEASYYTMAGAVRVDRALYRPLGERNGRTVDAVSLRAGVVGDGWLPHTAAAMAHELARSPSREAAASCDRLGRLPYSRCSFERVGHLVATAVREQLDEIEETLIEAFEIPKAARSVSASLDRVAVPMEEPRPRPRGRPRRGAPRNPIQRVFRMAYVATVTLHDADGHALHTIRYGGMPHLDPADLGEALRRDVSTLLGTQPSLEVVLLADGAKELWGVLEEKLSAKSLGIPGRQVTSLIDFWHVLEKLAGAASMLWAEEKARSQLAQWRRLLLLRRDAPATIRRTLSRSRGLNSWLNGAQPVREAATYLENNAHRMRYTRARRRGLPIGSGNVEATCKSLVSMRMKRPGARWKAETGEDVIQLRALMLSDRWNDATRLALRPLRASVQTTKHAA